MKTAVWIVGEPGTGKTTLARALLEPGMRHIAKPKWMVGEHVVAAGHYRGGTFDGADTVPYSGAAEALAYWRDALLARAALTIFDGDRFSYSGALSFVRAMPVRTCCILVTLAPEEAEARRRARGGKQNAAWVKGRATKARRFAEMIEDRLELDAAVAPEGLAERARAYLNAP